MAAKRPKPPSNKQHLDNLNSAHDRAHQLHAKADAARAKAMAASAKADLIHANIVAKGKEVVYTENGRKVVDRK